MNTQLQAENFSLRHQLENLLGEARLNEDKMRRFDQLERKLIAAESPKELIELLLTEYQKAFGVEYVALALLDHEYEIARSLEDESICLENVAELKLLQSSEPLDTIFRGSQRPILGAACELWHHALFNAAAGAVASFALLPLVRHGSLIGGFYLGSTNPNRYVSGDGTDFLERLSEIIAVCLDGTVTHERLKRIGLTDGLTGVQNRRYFEHRLHEEIAQACRHKRALACMFLDVDRFKRINDTFGHQSGDTVLRSVAHAIQAQLRLGDTIARYGGEEFVVLLPRTAPRHVQEIAERIRQTIAKQLFEAASGERIDVTISIGLSLLQSQDSAIAPQQLAEQLVASADKALYRAKHTGRNRVVYDDGFAIEADAPSAVSQQLPAVVSAFVKSTIAQAANMLNQLRQVLHA